MKKNQRNLLILFAGMVIISIIPSLKFPGGYRLFVVQSPSMEPTIKTKSLVIVQPQIEYQTTDIITFLSPNQNGGKYLTTTHRLQMIINQNGKILYMTKGDANKLSDEEFVQQEKVVGKVVKIIPFLGWLFNIIKSPMGIFLFVFLPAALIIRNEIVNINNLSN
jgi:signal peptidase